jgi:hypothetical protein
MATLLVFAITGCPNDIKSNPSVKVTGVNLAATSGPNPGTIYLSNDDPDKPSSVTLVATVVPTNAKNKTVTWEVEPETFADFDKQTLVVSAKAVGGPTTVTVTTADGNFSKVYTVTVLNPDEPSHEPVTDVNIDYSEDSLSFTKTDGPFDPASIQLGATGSPQTATIQTVTWSVEPEGVVTVSQNGLVTPIAAVTGNAVITVTSDEDEAVADTINVTVTVNQTQTPQEPVIYNFSEAPLNTLSSSNFTEVISLGGLTFGTGSNLLTQNAGTGGYNFTHCLRTNGAASASQRYVVVPLDGPATVTIYGSSNNSGATTMNITSSVESTANLATPALPLPPWNNSNLGMPTYTSTTVGPHTIVLKAAASARIFLIRVDYQ